MKIASVFTLKRQKVLTHHHIPERSFASSALHSHSEARARTRNLHSCLRSLRRFDSAGLGEYSRTFVLYILEPGHIGLAVAEPAQSGIANWRIRNLARGVYRWVVSTGACV